MKNLLKLFYIKNTVELDRRTPKIKIFIFVPTGSLFQKTTEMFELSRKI